MKFILHKFGNPRGAGSLAAKKKDEFPMVKMRSVHLTSITEFYTSVGTSVAMW